MTTCNRLVIENILNASLYNLNVLYTIGICRQYIRNVTAYNRNVIENIRNVSRCNLNVRPTVNDRRRYIQPDRAYAFNASRRKAVADVQR